jgi:hypothetical protein
VENGFMKSILFGLAMLMVFALPVYAASDCEHTCCYQYNGNWDDDFDDCGGSPAEGFDTCVSDCEAAVWNSMPQGPGPASPENTYHYECCASAFILGTVLLGGALCKENRL